MAPPAVASLAPAALTGGFVPARLAALGPVLASMVGEFARMPFAMFWWGWTFPTAAFAIALEAAAHAHPAPWQPPLLWLVLLGASAIPALALPARAEGQRVLAPVTSPEPQVRAWPSCCSTRCASRARRWK